MSGCSAACGREGEREEGERGRGEKKKREKKRRVKEKENGEEDKKQGKGERARAGGDRGVCGPGKACAAWRADQGRQRRVRPAIITVGGRAGGEGKKREEGSVGV